MTIMKHKAEPFFGDKYDQFVKYVYDFAEHDKLPMILNIEDTKGISLKDIGDFMQMFEQDTCFKTEVHAYICEECGKMHLDIEVWMPEEDESPYPLQ